MNSKLKECEQIEVLLEKIFKNSDDESERTHEGIINEIWGYYGQS